MVKEEYKNAVENITERTVEIPYLFKALKDGNILDVGSEASVYVEELLKMGRQVTRVDVRDMTRFNIGSEIIIKKDIREIKNRKYDNILFISSLEHMSLGCCFYGTTEDWKVSPFNEQLEILKHCYNNLLKEDGRIILTLPYGKYTEGGWYIIYDRKLIEEIENNFKIIDKKYFTIRSGVYVECTENDINMGDGLELMENSKVRSRNVICLTIQKQELYVEMTTGVLEYKVGSFINI